MGAAKGPLSNLQLSIKVNGSLKDEPVVIYWSGVLYRNMPVAVATKDYLPTGGFATPNTPLFKVAGFNIARFYRDEAIPGPGGATSPGYYRLSREIMFYLDPATGEIARTWENQWIPRNPDGSGGTVTKVVNVLQTFNDPVNFPMREADVGSRTYEVMGGRAVYGSDMFLRYPSPLAGEKYRRFSADDTYQNTESMRYFANMDELLDPQVDSVKDVLIAWSRSGQYLPWMHMGAAPGGIAIYTTGCKVPEGFEGLPEWMKKEVRANYPQYTEPPAGTYPQPNVNDTSWLVFKKELDAGRYIPTPIP